MKVFFVIFLLIFLVSCESANIPEMPTEIPVSQDTADEQTLSDIDAVLSEVLEEIPEGEDVEDQVLSNIEIIEAPYTNPKGLVDMQIEYALDNDGNIASIEASASTYDLEKFNTALQTEVIGQSLEEASEIYISGSSLTSAAYTNAMKSAL